MRVLIVGGGIMGLSTAHALHRAGHDVVLFEQGPLPNPLGSSVDTHRLIRHPYGDRLGYTRMVDEAFAAWDRLWQDLGVRLYHQTGTLAVSSTSDAWAHASAETLARAGHPVEWLSADDVARRVPVLRPDDIAEAFYLPTGGVLLAERIVAALAEHLAPCIELHVHTRVHAIDAEAATLDLGGGDVRGGDAVVVAAGPWVARLLPAYAERVTPSRQVVCYAEPPEGLRGDWQQAPMVLDIDPVTGFYVVPPRAGTGLKIGDHRFSLRGEPDADRVPLDDEAEAVFRMAAERFRSFESYRRGPARTCYYTVEPDERFVLERVGAGGWVMTGFSGHGFKFGAVVGERMAAAVTGALDADALRRWAAGQDAGD